MSNKKKPKKLRTPNVPPMLATPTATVVRPGAVESRNGGLELASEPHTVRSEPSRPAVTFDYSYVQKDLKRIGILAGSLIAVLVVLSFFIR